MANQNGGRAVQPNRILEADVVVIGSGAGGMTAAIVAADAGLNVVVLEKTEYFGGTTARSAGGIDIPCNHHMAELGQTDTRADAELYLRSVAGNYYDEQVVGAFLDNAPEMLSYMERRTEVKTDGMLFPDYEPWQPGAKLGRMVNPLPYDSRKLGKFSAKLRPPLNQLTILKGLQIRTIEVGDFVDVLHTPKSFVQCVKLMAPYFYQKIRYGRGTRLALGNALAGRLLKSCLDRDKIRMIDLAPVQRLIRDGDRVTGVVFNRDGEEWSAAAHRGVVLATGGFSANGEMRAKYLTQAQDGLTLQPPGNDGDGIRMGVAEGGAFVTNNAANGNWAPVSVMVEEDGSRVVYPHFVLDRHSAGTLTVGPDGKRFVNEGQNYQLFCNTMHAREFDRCFIIADHKFVRRSGLGMAPPSPMSLTPYLKRGYLLKARTLADLARKIGVEPLALTETVERFNEYARVGTDPEFHRGDDIYSAALGGGLGPNAALSPIESGPFYALEMRPGDFGSVAGLKINGHGQVVDSNGAAIVGLYAVGTTANSIFGGTYPTGGANIGPAMTFGYIAAKHLADARAPG
jgi:succinate dehydrogenase/fumarate reductase flavoprotein subunit